MICPQCGADDGWQRITSAPENVVVLTKIDDKEGVRNIQRLKRQSRLWYVPNGSMYVYYTPTHWRAPEAPEGT